ncbi:MAG: putative P-loop-containing kinase [Actinomycetia bacterium]|nr:putative P-loop-containing kinase [Actinomycetes bacterium]
MNARRARAKRGEFVVITGLSGAGRSQAANVLEDLGWFVIDNLPAALIDKVAELVRQPGSAINHVALVLGARDVEELTAGLSHLRDAAERVRVLFLEASDEVLVRRFEDTRRRHPFEDEGGLVTAIAKERGALEPLKGEADVVVDTSDLNVHQLRERIESLFSSDGPEGGLQTAVMSFGYKHGLPLDVDLVLDCRFLPNPHWVEELRPHTGKDPDVRSYVLGFPETGEFLDRLDNLLELLLPAYVAEGKSYLTIAMGCTGGHHRSVVMAEEVAALLRARGFEPRVTHREIAR